MPEISKASLTRDFGVSNLKILSDARFHEFLRIRASQEFLNADKVTLKNLDHIKF